MLETIGMVVVLIAAVYGIGEGLRRLAVRVLFPRPVFAVRLLLLDGDAEQLEYAVRGWMATREREQLLLVDRSLTADGAVLARWVSEAFSVPLCSVDDLPKMIRNGLQDDEKGV